MSRSGECCTQAALQKAMWLLPCLSLRPSSGDWAAFPEGESCHFLLIHAAVGALLPASATAQGLEPSLSKPKICSGVLQKGRLLLFQNQVTFWSWVVFGPFCRSNIRVSSHVQKLKIALSSVGFVLMPTALLFRMKYEYIIFSILWRPVTILCWEQQKMPFRITT